jgi:hypothetical protein
MFEELPQTCYFYKQILFLYSELLTIQYIFYRMFYFLDDKVSKGVCVYQQSEVFLYLPFHFMQPLNPCVALASPGELNPCSWRFYSQYFSQRLPSSIYSHLCSFLFYQNSIASAPTAVATSYFSGSFILFSLWLFRGWLHLYVSSTVRLVYRLKSVNQFINGNIIFLPTSEGIMSAVGISGSSRWNEDFSIYQHFA